MKRFYFAVVLLIFLVARTVQAETIVIHVRGMVCGFCAQSIQKTFSKEAAVEAVNVDLAAKIVTLKTKDKSQFEDEKIRTILLDAGYNTDAIERKP